MEMPPQPPLWARHYVMPTRVTLSLRCLRVCLLCSAPGAWTGAGGGSVADRPRGCASRVLSFETRLFCASMNQVRRSMLIQNTRCLRLSVSTVLSLRPEQPVSWARIGWDQPSMLKAWRCFTVGEQEERSSGRFTGRPGTAHNPITSA